MELSQEFIEKNQLSTEQVSAITDFASTHIASLQKDWQGKANENAEAIINGAGNKVIELTGIQRNQGEKWADYLSRANGLYFEGTKTALERKQAELNEKIKSAGSDETLKSELELVKNQLDSFKEKAANYEEWEKADYKGRYEKASEKLTAMERKIAFKSVIPARPDNVNKYEWDAKVKEWEMQALESNHLVFDDNDTAWLVDKENEFKKTKLEDSFKQNKELQTLLEGRKQDGLKSNAKQISIDGLPFKLPENATPQDRAKAIKEYLASQNINPMSDNYSSEYARLNKIALGLEKKPEK